MSVLLPLIFSVLIGLGPAVATNASPLPAITVKPHPAYTMRPLTFMARHLGPRAWWTAEMHNPNPNAKSDDEIRLGMHRTNRYGVLRFTHAAIRGKGAHFGSKAYEVWLVNVEFAHPVGAEPAPVSTKFRMFHGCGCGGR